MLGGEGVLKLRKMHAISYCLLNRQIDWFKYMKMRETKMTHLGVLLHNLHCTPTPLPTLTIMSVVAQAVLREIGQNESYTSSINYTTSSHDVNKCLYQTQRGYKGGGGGRGKQQGLWPSNDVQQIIAVQYMHVSLCIHFCEKQEAIVIFFLWYKSCGENQTQVMVTTSTFS